MYSIYQEKHNVFSSGYQNEDPERTSSIET